MNEDYAQKKLWFYKRSVLNELRAFHGSGILDYLGSLRQALKSSGAEADHRIVFSSQLVSVRPQASASQTSVRNWVFDASIVSDPHRRYELDGYLVGARLSHIYAISLGNCLLV